MLSDILNASFFISLLAGMVRVGNTDSSSGIGTALYTARRYFKSWRRGHNDNWCGIGLYCSFPYK